MPDQAFIVLFRGVGGQTKLPSAPLRDALAAAGFGDVTTYIATGNVVLTSKLSAAKVREGVAAIAWKKLVFSKSVRALEAHYENDIETVVQEVTEDIETLLTDASDRITTCIFACGDSV